MLVEGQIGPVVGQDGTQQQVRQARDASLVTNDGHARYYEPTVRALVFSATGPMASATSSSSTAVAAAGTFPAASSPLGALWNPASTGKNAVIIRGGFSEVSAGTGPGILLWALGPTAAITAGTKLPINGNNGTGGGSVCTAYGATSATAIAALTGQSQVNVLRPLINSSGAQAVFGTGVLAAYELTDGDIVVPPGNVLILAGTIAGATLVGGFTIEWEEVAV